MPLREWQIFSVEGPLFKQNKFTIHYGCDHQSMIWKDPMKLRENEMALYFKWAEIWGHWRQTRGKYKEITERAKEQAASINRGWWNKIILFSVVKDREVWYATVSIQFSSVTQSCPTLCNPMDCSTPGFHVHHQLLELVQTHVHWVSDTIQPSHPLSSPFPPAFNLSQHQGLFKWVSSSNQVAKVLELQLQHQSFQWVFRTDFL